MSETEKSVEKGIKRTQSNGEPISHAELVHSLATAYLHLDELKIEAIKEMAEWFPPLASMIQFAPELRGQGDVTKRWNRFFNQIYPAYLNFAINAYEKIGNPEYNRDYPTLSYPQRVWKFMGEMHAAIREQTVAKLFEMLPELKTYQVYEIQSKEKMEVISRVVQKPEERKRPTYRELGLNEYDHRER